MSSDERRDRGKFDRKLDRSPDLGREADTPRSLQRVAEPLDDGARLRALEEVDKSL